MRRADLHFVDHGFVEPELEEGLVSPTAICDPDRDDGDGVFAQGVLDSGLSRVLDVSDLRDRWVWLG